MIDINRFTAGKYDPRSYLSHPWQEDGNTFATNGHFCIMVEGVQDAGLPQPDLKMVGRIPALLAVDIQRVPVEIDFAANRPITCACCDGTGLVTVTKCDDCDGKGEFDHGRHTYECQNCDATGEVRWMAEQGDKNAEACPECLGTGYASKTITITVGQVKHAYQEKYLRLFAELPNARLLLSPSDHNAAGLFLFDGGRGLVMPMQC